MDRHIGGKIAARRISLGLTQEKMADLIGVTYQQAHKYEKGINRVAAGRLYHIAQALGVDVGYFFEDIETGTRPKRDPNRRMLLDLSTNFQQIRSPVLREAVTQLARTLAHAYADA